MKPLELVLTNFGPYKGENRIDFTQLRSPLYLITGPTGAGKTYIFDAICFALYGGLSGDNRGTDDVRCQLAEPTDVARVEFTFEYQGSHYTIQRTPKQKVWSNKTNDYKSPGESIKFTVGGETFTAIKEVNDKIKTLLGLDRNQFKMTMMIAQGDFYKLINAKTVDRKPIFRQILRTERLSQFILNLETKMEEALEVIKDKEREMRTLRKQIISYNSELTHKIGDDLVLDIEVRPLIDLELNEDKALLSQYETYKNDMQHALNQAVTNLDRVAQNNQHKVAYDGLVKKEAELKAEKPTIDALKEQLRLAQLADQINQAFLAYDKAKKAKETLEKQIRELIEKRKLTIPALEQAKKDYEAAKLKEAQRPELYRQRGQLEQLKEALDKKTQASAKIIELNKQMEGLKGSQEKVVKEFDASKKALSELKGQIEAFQGEFEKQQIEGDIKALKGEVSRLEPYQETVKQYLKTTIDLVDNQALIENTLKLFNEVNNEWHQAQRLYMTSQAGILAETLKLNEPCPVCGSFDHPQPAKKLAQTLTQEALDELEAKVTEKRNEFNDATSQRGTIKTRLELFENKLAEILPLPIQFNLVTLQVKSLIAEKKQILEGLTLKLTLVQQAIDAHKARQNQAKKLEGETIPQFDKQLLQLTENVNKLNTQKETALALVQDADSKLGTHTEKSIADALNALNQQISTIEKQWKLADETLKDLQQKEGQETTALTLHQEKLLQVKADFDHALEAFNLSLNGGGFASVEAIKPYLLTKQQVSEKEERIRQYDIDVKVNATNLAIAKTNKYDELTLQDVAEYTRLKDQAKANFDQAFDNFSQLKSKIESNQRHLARIDEIYRSCEPDKIKAEELRTLYMTASGKDNRQGKIDFEVFYQAQVFQRILNIASPKFSKMSGGRYLFERETELSKQSQSGLDLKVIDRHYGSSRAVSSLSGGESFQATLSLALSFSEAIQAQAGGVELNSMFIDEGFGTLDSDALDKTKKILFEVGESTNRSVAIISHVEELDRTIPTKIVVTKTEQGSTVTIRND